MEDNINNNSKFIPTGSAADVINQNSVKCRPVLPKMDHADFVTHKDGTVSGRGKTKI